VVMQKIRLLYDLQAVDFEVDTRRVRLTDIAAKLVASSGLDGLQVEMDDHKESLRKATNQQRDLEDTVARQTERVDENEAKLYSGAIKVPRELEDLQAEVTQLKNQRSGIEDLLLEALERVDEFEASFKRVDDKLKRGEAAWKAEETSLTDEQARLSAEVNALTGQRTVMSGNVDSGMLSLYEQVRKAHEGVAVAQVQRDNCEACRISLPNRQLQELRTATAPVRCNNCGRILLVD
jgi:predicted  nucleic acid-binding Zn-ribbon protein